MLCARLYLLAIVITVIIGTSNATPPIPSACELNICKCLQEKLMCSCVGQARLMELKQEGNGFIPDYIAEVRVENCEEVIVFSQSIEKVRGLRQVKLANIGKLVLQEKSFNWRERVISNWQESRIAPNPQREGIKIEIVNSNIAKIPNHAFQGYIDSIVIDNSRIDNIEAFAFSSLDYIMDKLILKNCRIENFEQHSFKKFVVNYFILEGGKIGVMNSYTIRDLIVEKDMRIQGVNFGIVKTLAVTVVGPSAFRIKECLFELIESEAFKIHTKGPVFIDDNIVRDLRMGAFIGITLEPTFYAHNDKQELLFENNTLTKINNGPIMFNTTGLEPRIERLVLNMKCSCTEMKNWQTKLIKYQGKQTVMPDITKQTWCYDGNKEVTISQYNDKKCKMNRTMLYIIIGLSVGAIVCIALCIGGFIFYRKWKKMYKAVKVNRELINENRFSTYSNSSNHVIVLPRPKTYLETEIDDCNEEVQPLKNSKSDLNNLKETGL